MACSSYYASGFRATVVVVVADRYRSVYYKLLRRDGRGILYSIGSLRHRHRRRRRRVVHAFVMRTIECCSNRKRRRSVGLLPATAEGKGGYRFTGFDKIVGVLRRRAVFADKYRIRRVPVMLLLLLLL